MHMSSRSPSTVASTCKKSSTRCQMHGQPERDGVTCFVTKASSASRRRETILEAAATLGFGLRLHAEEIAHTGAAGLAAELGCASADHLEHVSATDAKAMAAAGVVGVLLPTVTLSLRTFAFDQVAVLKEAGVELALATDCNPGTSWCESMPYVIQLACLVYGLSVEEALRAATLGGAHSLRRNRRRAVVRGSAWRSRHPRCRP